MEPQETFAATLKDALFVAFVAALIFMPMIGLTLDGYSLNNNLFQASLFVGAIFFGRLALNLIYRTDRLGGIFKKVLSQKMLDVEVAQPDRSKRNFYLLNAAIVLVAACLPFFLSKYYSVVLIQCMIYVILGLGLNIVVGWAGMLDLGFVAFYAVGAYSMGLLNFYFDLGFWEVIPIAAVIAAFTGMLLGFPVLRMHGDYLAIVTLGFGEIIRLVLNNWVELTGGPNGISIPKITFFGLKFAKRGKETFHQTFGLEYDSSHVVIFIYLLLLAFVVCAVLFCFRLKKMPLGRAWEALREDEIACRSMGINHVNVKLAAFMLGAVFGGLGGVFFATYQGFINPTSFTFIESALIVAVVVLGGLGSIPGVIVAAVVLNLLPEIFRELENLRILIFGLVMVVMMIWRPRGLLRIVRPRFIVEKRGEA